MSTPSRPSFIDQLNEFFTKDYWTQYNIETLIQQFAYQGFNAQIIYEEMYRLSGGRNVKGDLARPDGQQLLKDVFSICAFVDERGTRIDRDKVKGKTSKEGYAVMESLMTKYGIRPTGRPPTSVKEITLQRVVLAFPHVYIYIRAQRYERGKLRTVGADDLPAPTNAKEIILWFPGGAGMIPQHENANEIFDRYLVWAIAFDKTIKREKHDEKAVRNFAKIARQGTTLTDSERWSVLVSLGIASSAET